MSAHFKQAVAHFEKGDAAKAQACVNAALGQDPQNGDAWHLHGVMALNAGHTDDAVEALTRAVALLPKNAVARTYLAAALNAAQRYGEAETAAKDAVALNPKIAEAQFQLGQAQVRRGQAAQAIKPLEDCLALRPGWVDAQEMLAHCLLHIGRHEPALRMAREVLASDANRALAHRVVADVYNHWQKYDDAIAHFETSLRLSPHDGDTHNNYALALTRMGREDEALREYEAAVALRPTPLVRASYGLALLAAGRLAEGWPHYAARPKTSNAIGTMPESAPPATVTEIAGQSVLAWFDQGVGDQIMFSSLVPDVVAAGARLTLACDPRLVPLFQRSFAKDVRVRAVSDLAQTPGDATAYRYRFRLPDIAGWFRARFADFPRRDGYLQADPAATQKLRQAYARRAGGRPIIGISWRTAIDAQVSEQKTLALLDWALVLAGRSALFVSLQYGDTAQEVAEAARTLGADIVHDDTVDPLHDLDAFAAQVAAMDLVITTSNATAHMAGGLNVPVWTLAPHGFGAMWHWFRDRADSPWYSSMRLFRQQTVGAWKPVLAEAGAALSQFIAAWPR